MKKTALLVLTLIIASTINAQIGTTTVAVPQQKEQKPVFDSTKNFLGSTNVQSYVGQILFVSPVTLGSHEYGYENFKPIDYDPNDFYSRRSHYGRNSEKSIYNTLFEDLAGKYFRVDSISETSYTQYLFYLTNTKDEADRCCFIYSALYKTSFPFIVLSHFNYLNERYVGKQYIIQSDFYIHHIDIITGDSIKIEDDPKNLWTATELTIINSKQKVFAFVIKNGNMTSYIDAERFAHAFDTDSRRYIFEVTEWNSLVKKYGLAMMKLVLNEEIKVGMPEKLLFYSWGKPERVNSSSNENKQYVYDNNYVYVKDGKVVSWQSSR